MQKSTKKILAFGTFDLFHMGHFYYLKQCRSLGDHLTVIVARDQNVLRNKGELPWENEQARRSKVVNSGVVDDVRLGYTDWTKHEQVLIDIQPDIVCLGFDQKIPVPPGPYKIKKIPFYKPHLYKTSLIKKRFR